MLKLLLESFSTVTKLGPILTRLLVKSNRRNFGSFDPKHVSVIWRSFGVLPETMPQLYLVDQFNSHLREILADTEGHWASCFNINDNLLRDDRPLGLWKTCPPTNISTYHLRVSMHMHALIHKSHHWAVIGHLSFSPVSCHQRRKKWRFALLSLALGLNELGIRLGGSESV